MSIYTDDIGTWYKLRNHNRKFYKQLVKVLSLAKAEVSIHMQGKHYKEEKLTEPQQEGR